MAEKHSNCPECGERLSFGALRCACGWGNSKKTDKHAKYYDMRCTFKDGSERCEYPVGLFTEGATSGWCIFHRQSHGVNGAEIVRQSQTVPYVEAIKPLIDAGAKSAAVRDCAWTIALRHGNKPWQSDDESLARILAKERAA